MAGFASNADGAVRSDELGPGLRSHHGKRPRPGVVSGKDGVVVVDARPAPAAARFFADVADRKVSQGMPSHYHAVHTLGRERGAPVNHVGTTCAEASDGTPSARAAKGRGQLHIRRGAMDRMRRHSGHTLVFGDCRTAGRGRETRPAPGSGAPTRSDVAGG